MKTRIALNGNQGNWRIGIGETARWECFSDVDWHALDAFIERYENSTRFITLSYELRHAVTGERPDKPHAFPLVRTWVAESVYETRNGQLVCTEGTDTAENRLLANACLEEQKTDRQFAWKPVQSKADYLEQVRLLQQHIQRGDIYEVNYCQSLTANAPGLTTILPLYQAINRVSSAPYSFLYESADWMLAGASPERFLARKGNRLISQPIKGTAPRSSDGLSDENLRNNLKNSHKDRTENVMIVDLVRNDLSRVAARGTVRVDELFGIYTFPTVHQMISTVSCEVRPEVRFSEIIRATFPMGSMTGAPKVSAMQLAAQTERFTRGIYAGSVGYLAPGGDFDLNVVIRTIAFQQSAEQLACGVGGAITILSDPEAEYEECRVKVGKLLSTLGTCQW